jgi:hypothetical protein
MRAEVATVGAPEESSPLALALVKGGGGDFRAAVVALQYEALTLRSILYPVGHAADI